LLRLHRSSKSTIRRTNCCRKQCFNSYLVLLTVTYSSTLHRERIVAFSCERATMLGYTYIACLVYARQDLFVKLLFGYYFVTDFTFFMEGIYTDFVLLFLFIYYTSQNDTNRLNISKYCNCTTIVLIMHQDWAILTDCLVFY
jgi:hypothetical protein